MSDAARPGPGSAAEEAATLFAAAEQWVRAHGAGGLGAEHLATGSPECTACPVCQAIGAVRHVRPETVAHLLDAGASLVAALRSAVAPEPAEPQTGGHVQRIDLDLAADAEGPAEQTDHSEVR
jgi:hypothetical protein